MDIQENEHMIEKITNEIFRLQKKIEKEKSASQVCILVYNIRNLEKALEKHRHIQNKYYGISNV